jgi:hypothetical protein
MAQGVLQVCTPVARPYLSLPSRVRRVRCDPHFMRMPERDCHSLHSFLKTRMGRMSADGSQNEPSDLPQGRFEFHPRALS